MQYYDHYLVYGATASTSLRNTSIANQGSDTIPSQLYHDLFVRYRFAPNPGFARGLLANAELMVGIGNVFDTEPPLIATTSATSRGYSAFGNPRLRRYTISLTRSFD
jgi:outer membrane receptor protein involved in Fe transport